MIPLPVPASEFNWPDMTAEDLGSLEKLRDAKHLHWYPAETDTSIRPGWFWHESENDKVRSLNDLLNCFCGAVGGNSVLLLNVPPDRRGLIHENDAARLKELGAVLRATFGNVVGGMGAGGSATSSFDAEGHPAAAATDGSVETFWTTPDWTIEPLLVLTMPSERHFDVVMIQEHIASGQRIGKFAVDVWDQAGWSAGRSGWKEVGSGTTVGYKKLLRIQQQVSSRVRVRILESRVRPTIAELALYQSPSRLPAPKITRGRDGMVTITGTVNAGLCYTIDGTEPRAGVNTYEGPFPLPGGGIVKARAIGLGPEVFPTEVAAAEFGFAKGKWRIAEVSSEQVSAHESAQNAIDDDRRTLWHTRYSPETSKHPHWIIIDLGESVTMKAITYTPRPTATGPNGTVAKYEVYTSEDGQSWNRAAAGILARAGEQKVPFEAPRRGRYLKFVALSDVNGRDWASAAEFGVVTR